MCIRDRSYTLSPEPDSDVTICDCAEGDKPLEIAPCSDPVSYTHLEALVQDDLITLQSQCACDAQLRNFVLGVGVGSDTADASVRRETGE